MTQHRPISFLATAQPEKARAFYAEVIGLPLTETSAFALIFDNHGTMLRIQIVPEVTVAPYTAHGWQVPDIATEMTRLRDMGVAFLTFDALPQDANGVWTTPDGAKIAWFKDPCGNTLSLTEVAP